MRILWHSNAPWAPTGYGQQTALFTDLIAQAGHEVAISSLWGLNGKKLDWGGIPVYPGGPDFGDTWVPVYAADWGGNDCQVITLQDVWKWENFPAYKLLNLAAWVPIDHDPAPPIVVNALKRAEALPIAMSRFGEDRLRQAGFDPLYAPHGIDTAKFKPTPQKDARENAGFPLDAFVVGMVANNQGNAPPRKAYPQVFEAFAEFAKRHDDAILYVHCQAANIATGMNLPVLAEMTGIPDGRLRFAPPFPLHIGIPMETMGELYSCFDVLVSPSYGEGFGIPIIEAQACGVPVITNNWTAMPELTGDGWIVDGEPWWDMSQGSYFKHARVGDILDALEEAYERRGGGSVKARQFAVDYDAARVFDTYWVPILETLERRMKERVEMPAVTLNRAQRRRRKNAA